MKPITFAEMKNIRRKNLNELNRYFMSIYASAKQEGIDSVEENTIAELTEEQLLEILLSVKGIGQKRADEIIKKILEVNT